MNKIKSLSVPFRNLRFHLNKLGIPMRIQLFLLLTLLVVSTILGVLVILTINGTFTMGIRETEKDISQELTHLHQEIDHQFDQMSAHTVEYANELSFQLERNLAQRGLHPEDLKNHPELLEEVIASEYDLSLFTMQRAQSSGVFLILDATVNPEGDHAEFSKSGLYIKDMEPNILHSGSSYLFILRGPSEIGRQHAVTLHPQWRMEFDVDNAPYFQNPIRAARENDLPVSRLYYWNPGTTLPGTSEEVMLCSAPLVDSRGGVYGVCGLEISSMLFKMSHIPENNNYQRLLCLLAPQTGSKLSVSESLASGSYSLRNIKENGQSLFIKENEPFPSYRMDNGPLFSGLHKKIGLYPQDSAFKEESWVVLLAMPDEDISASVIQLNKKLLILFCILLFTGIFLSYILSKKFLLPLSRGIEIIKSSDYRSRTNNPEIDDLIEFLSTSIQTQTLLKETPPVTEKLPSVIFDEFVKNTRLLSPAERAVFDLYVQGYTATEITKILCLSINTIKTHNKRIYMKLNVASREELLVYVNMLKEAGRDII